MSIETIYEVDGRIEAVGGLSLYYQGWEADEPKAAILVVHGLAEHGGRYAGVGRRMAGFGISTYAVDLRGHGLSDGRRGHVDRFELLLQDIDRFRREIEGGLEAELPLFALGHSMGGLIVARYIEAYGARFAGAILTSPWLATAMPIPRWKVLAANVLKKLLPALPIDAGINEKYLSHDPGVVARYRDDPLVHGKITPRMFAEVSTAMGLVMQRADQIRIPLLFLLAGDDRLVDTRKSEAFARTLKTPDVTIRVMADYYHEVLKDHDRALAAHEIRDWILARLPERQV
ncbi:MAG: lysophospholipase [Gemmatimonadota bacterium]